MSDAYPDVQGCPNPRLHVQCPRHGLCSCTCATRRKQERKNSAFREAVRAEVEKILEERGLS